MHSAAIRATEVGKGGVAVQVEGMRAGSTAQRDQYPVWPLQGRERGT